MSKDELDRRAYEKYRKQLADQARPKQGFWKSTWMVIVALVAVLAVTLVNSLGQAYFAQFPRWVGLSVMAGMGLAALVGWLVVRALKKRRG